MEKKICSKCKFEKDVCEFYVNHKNILEYYKLKYLKQDFRRIEKKLPHLKFNSRIDKDFIHRNTSKI